MCVFHPRESNYLLISSYPEQISLFDLTTNTILPNIPKQHKRNVIFDFSEIGSIIISASEDEICLWKNIFKNKKSSK